MSNKSSASIISLPKGGGALQGIGEKFSPDLFTGTGNFTVPIALPPGRNGFQPELNLVYSTGNGNGPFGLGWSLSIPGVSRKTSKGIPIYDDSKDTFILSGAEDLVPVEESDNITRYRPRTEGLFARIEHHKDTENDYWKVCSKDGLISYYGTPRMDEADPDWQDPAVIADPDPLKRDKVFAWKLTETRDPFGNRIVYNYDRDLGEKDGHFWDQLYLKQIRYVDSGSPEDDNFLVSVTFEYGEPVEERPDPFSEYRPGFEIRTRRRCKRILVCTHAGKDRRVRTYELVYLDEREGVEHKLPLNNLSLLSQIKVVGHDDDQPEVDDKTEELPPLEFGYTIFEPEKRNFFPLEGSLPARSLADSSLELVDLFGNGLPDIMEMNGTVRYWRNLGNGRYDMPREMNDAPAGLQLADPGVQMIDADGDGRTDLMVTTPGLSGYFPLRFGGLWDRKSFQKYDLAPSFNLEDPEVQLVDLDGDGVTDAIRSGSRLECFFNDPKEGWNSTRTVERRALEEFPNINFSDPRVKWADMSGDGLQDILLVYDGNVKYWPNLGYGNWGKWISMRNSPRFPYGYDPKRILVGDVDGDGLADIVYIEDTKVTLWINHSGNGWSDPIEIQGTPSVTDMDAVRLVDMLGTGISGVLWSRDAAEPGRETMFFLDFTGRNKPYLLHEMNDHMGAITRVKYAPSTRFYLENQKSPDTRWKTPLPFPVRVVSCVEVIDEISKGKLTTEYSYHHGYWDGAEREFRGFGRVDQRDTEVFEDFHAPGLHPGKEFKAIEQKIFSPPLETRTWFHQGPVGDEFGEWEETDYSNEYWSGDPQALERPHSMTDFLKGLPRRVKRNALRTLRGSILRTELYALDDTERRNRPYTVTESLFGVREEPGPGDDEFRIFFPHVLARRATQWERGDEPMTTFAFTDNYDEYGQPRSQFSIAVPRGRDYRETLPEEATSEPYLATFSETELINRDDHTHYLIGRVVNGKGYESINDGRQSVFELAEAIRCGTAERKILSQAITYYDGPAFEGLPYGQIGDFGAPVRTETLVLTEDILHQAYKSGSDVLDPPEVPPCMIPGETPAWPGEYPQEFRDRLPALAGYLFHEGGEDSPYAKGYFTIAERQRFDFHDDPAVGRGLLKQTRDPLGNDITIDYDEFEFLPAKVTDPAGLETQAVYDYRVLQPKLVIDLNNNRIGFTFSPLGLLTATAVMGKQGEGIGDTMEVPGSSLEYDFFAFIEREQPVSVRTITREHHVNDLDVPLPEREATIKTIEYSDGFGRLLQTRTQAEDVIFGESVFGDDVGLPADQSLPASNAFGHKLAEGEPPRVIVSGWQIYNNKGWVVEQYEPFFSKGYDYALPADEELGQKVTTHYDPRGQVIHNVNPDGSEQKVIYGIPNDLDDPEQFTPTPWEAYTYDENDNAGRTHNGDSQTSQYRHHWNTPANIVIDALGRTVEAVERNRAAPESGELLLPIEEYRITSTYDIRGNLLTVTDALDRLAFQYAYDLANNPLRIENIDAGIRRTILDAAGNEIERRDSKEALILQAYDRLNRPIRLWTRDGTDQPVTLRERLIYGDSAESDLTIEQARAANLRGQLFQYYDEAGLLTLEAMDFKGNMLEKTRRVINDEAILSVLDPPPPGWRVPAFRVNWQPPEGKTLADHAAGMVDTINYRTSATYDALNRVKKMLYPEDVAGERKELSPQYNRAGALEKVEMDGTTYVERIAYNAKGQRVLIAYGNGVITRYVYDPHTFRLCRLRSERYEELAGAEITYHPTAPSQPLQDFAYVYDLAGNILNLRDRTPDSGVPNTTLGTDALDRDFTYDPLYRLISATGRECDHPPDNPLWDTQPRCTDITKACNYSEQYQYDPLGNILEFKHRINSGGFTRRFSLVAGTNRLNTVRIGTADYAYDYDDNGNMVQENNTRHFEWDHSDQMRVFRIQTEAADAPPDSGELAEPSVHAHYHYDAAGERVKKLVRKQGGRVEVAVYVDGVFEYHRIAHGDTIQENNTLHVMDDKARIAMVRVGEPFLGDTSPTVKYHLGDHLGSSNVVVGGDGGFINREEYTPYGETSFGSFAKKRYRFTGKERDEESGLNYHGARYYSPWLARWVSCDPDHTDLNSIQENGTTRIASSVNLYSAFRQNPNRYIDADGRQPSSPKRPKPEGLLSRWATRFNKGSWRSFLLWLRIRTGSLPPPPPPPPPTISSPRSSSPPPNPPNPPKSRRPPFQRGFIGVGLARTLGILALTFVIFYKGTRIVDEEFLGITDRIAEHFARSKPNPAEYPNYYLKQAIQNREPLSPKLEKTVITRANPEFLEEYKTMLEHKEELEELSESEDLLIIGGHLDLDTGEFDINIDPLGTKPMQQESPSVEPPLPIEEMENTNLVPVFKF